MTFYINQPTKQSQTETNKSCILCCCIAAISDDTCESNIQKYSRSMSKRAKRHTHINRFADKFFVEQKKNTYTYTYCAVIIIHLTVPRFLIAGGNRSVMITFHGSCAHKSGEKVQLWTRWRVEQKKNIKLKCGYDFYRITKSVWISNDGITT